MTIEEIYYSEGISVRSFNICNDNGLKDLPSILSYFQENKTFDNLRNCGRKSNEELIELCLKYIDKENLGEDESTKTENPLIARISNLSRTQREIVNSFIDVNLNNLTNRSKNAISILLNGNLKIRNLSERILTNERFNIQSINNVGAKSKTELNSFIGLIKSFVENVSNAKDESELISIKNRFFIEKSFSISEIPSEILDSRSIFKLTDFLIGCNAVFEKNKNLIFQKAIKVYQNKSEPTLDEIAKELNLSRERVRMIRKSILGDLFTNFQFVRSIEDEMFQKYQIEINQNCIFIDDDLTSFINGSNKTNFSKEFISYLVYVYTSDKFSLIGNLDDVLLPKYFNYRDFHKWECFYLIDREIDKIFRFNDFADDIDRRLNERIEKTYKFNFKSYLSNFLKDPSFDFLEQVTEIAELILNNEFGIYVDIEDNIQFFRKSIKPAYEYSYEALKQLGKPAKVSEITRKILELNPDYETDEGKVRASMKRHNGFVPIGRNSVFGLKAWENELENFKGGTIRSIVLEYLESCLNPQHISTITPYVLKFRPKSNERSILQNLKQDESGSFLFFKNSYIGLSNNEYDTSYILVNDENTFERKTWEERYSDLTKFLNKNDRLPLSSGCPESEIKLYRWYKIQLRKSKKGDLDFEKSLLIKDVFERCAENLIRKRITNVADKYNELLTFVLKRKRLPSANKEGEEHLYQFFYKQKKIFDKGELKPDEEYNFIKVARIIQTHKYEN